MRLLRRSLLALPLLVLAACVSPTESTGNFALETRSALDLLPADAQMVGLLNLAEARASDAIGPLYDAGFRLDTMTGEGAARLEDFMERTGFDLSEDVARVYVAGAPEDGRFVALLYADYDRARVDTYLQEQADVDTERLLYRETPLYLSEDGGGDRFSFALPNDEVMVGGTDALVRGVLDRMATGGSGLRSDVTMMALLEHAAHPDDAWFAVRGMNVTAPAGGHHDALLDASRFMRNVVVSAGFGDAGLDLSFFGQTATDTDPRDVADLVRGAVSGMRMSAKDEPELLRTLDGVRVREARDAVRVEAFVSETLLADMRR